MVRVKGNFHTAHSERCIFRVECSPPDKEDSNDRLSEYHIWRYSEAVGTRQPEDHHDLHQLRAGSNGERAAESAGFIIFLDGPCSGILALFLRTANGEW